MEVALTSAIVNFECSEAEFHLVCLFAYKFIDKEVCARFSEVAYRGSRHQQLWRRQHHEWELEPSSRLPSSAAKLLHEEKQEGERRKQRSFSFTSRQARPYHAQGALGPRDRGRFLRINTYYEFNESGISWTEIVLHKFWLHIEA